VHRLWVGADGDVMRPLPRGGDERFRIFVYASFSPLHGLEHVMRAAQLLGSRGIEFEMDVVGGGPTAKSVRRLAEDLNITSVRFLNRRPYDELPALMASAHVCLGIFGTSGKAQRVIPNKVFDALAAARAVVTADTPAAREVLTDGENARLCPPGDPEALAEALATLERQPDVRERIAHRGHQLFRTCFSVDALTPVLSGIVLDVCSTR
jgi:glycosyltransferase involved in cell wall biosynthesis